MRLLGLGGAARPPGRLRLEPLGGVAQLDPRVLHLDDDLAVLVGEAVEVVDRRDRLVERLGAEQDAERIRLALDVELRGCGRRGWPSAVGERRADELEVASCRVASRSRPRRTWPGASTTRASTPGRAWTRARRARGRPSATRAARLAFGLRGRGVLPRRLRGLDGVCSRCPEKGERSPRRRRSATRACLRAAARTRRHATTSVCPRVVNYASALRPFPLHAVGNPC